jgi:hypothetical protein
LIERELSFQIVRGIKVRFDDRNAIHFKRARLISDVYRGYEYDVNCLTVWSCPISLLFDLVIWLIPRSFFQVSDVRQWGYNRRFHQRFAQGIFRIGRSPLHSLWNYPPVQTIGWVLLSSVSILGRQWSLEMGLRKKVYVQQSPHLAISNSRKSVRGLRAPLLCSILNFLNGNWKLHLLSPCLVPTHGNTLMASSESQQRTRTRHVWDSRDSKRCNETAALPG